MTEPVSQSFDDGWDDDDLFDDDGRLIDAAPREDEADEFGGIKLHPVIAEIEDGFDHMIGQPTYARAAVGFLLERDGRYAGRALTWVNVPRVLAEFETRAAAVAGRRALLQLESNEAAERLAAKSRPCVVPIVVRLNCDTNASPAEAAKVELSAAAMSVASCLASVFGCSPDAAVERLLSEVIGGEIKRVWPQ